MAGFDGLNSLPGGRVLNCELVPVTLCRWPVDVPLLAQHPSFERSSSAGRLEFLRIQMTPPRELKLALKRMKDVE